MKALGLKQKIWLTIMLVSVLTISIGTGLTYYLYEKFYVDEQQDALMIQGEQLVSYYNQAENKDEFRTRVEWTDNTSDAEIIYTEDPMLLSAGIPNESFSDSNLITYEERQKLLDGEKVVFIRKHPRFDQDILAVTLPLIEENKLAGAVFLYMPLTAIFEPFQSIRIILVALVTILLLVVLGLGIKMTNHIIQPVKEMEAISYEMAQGNFYKRMKVTKSDEIGHLAESFNVLASTLEEVDQKRREFLQNVSHELRTPLSYIRGYAEAFEDLADEPEQRKKYIQIINNEVNRLIRLVNDLLDLAQLEDESYPMKKEPLPYAQLIADVMERFEIVLNQKRVQIVSELEDDIVVLGDTDRLEQVVSNLLDNSIRYSPEGQAVKIILKKHGMNAQLMIKDVGPGIPEDELPQIMERFYRVNRARTRKDGGTGIGLSIVYQIVSKHQGNIKFESQPGEGTTVLVEIPLFQ
ncbi:sensor histidine kinase [Gracilibacillus salinarum]|uniref:histidine kinase n=1 Tax=Gracilibacillus salinarum TaxID=2932255 RepID=A0ABY4GIR4_9BACI|nr:HAMP domain-containing sensor histidine kinase [Gracilibacillus salinarum]UOQ84081.1 ATP-binding protein [Gracilibacillus salinarum]